MRGYRVLELWIVCLSLTAVCLGEESWGNGDWQLIPSTSTDLLSTVLPYFGTLHVPEGSFCLSEAIDINWTSSFRASIAVVKEGADVVAVMKLKESLLDGYDMDDNWSLLEDVETAMIRNRQKDTEEYDIEAESEESMNMENLPTVLHIYASDTSNQIQLTFTQDTNKPGPVVLLTPIV